MKYWYDMLTKGGFGDGNSTPDGIEIFRDVYLKVVNELARRNGSSYRYVPYNRSGVHNFCLVILVPRQYYDETYLSSQEGREIWKSVDDDVVDQLGLHEADRDQAMKDAVSKACELYLDQYLDVTVNVDPGFTEFLTGPMLTEDEEWLGEDGEEELEEQTHN